MSSNILIFPLKNFDFIQFRFDQYLALFATTEFFLNHLNAVKLTFLYRDCDRPVRVLSNAASLRSNRPASLNL